MPSGRRNIGKPGLARSPTGGSSMSEEFLRSKCPMNSLNERLSCKVVTPKHIPIPHIPQESTIIFELYMFIFTTVASFLQFLHLYRSVWWLPQSYTRYTMNFYLIDPYLVGFIITILSRRLVYSVLSHLVCRCTPTSLWPLFQKIITLILLITVLTSLVYCAFHIMKNHPIVNIFYLCYPISVYFILFGLSVAPFFDITSFPVISKENKKNKPLVGKPIHSCSVSPQFIRKEVEMLKTDFNCRMKQVLFSSVLSAYYSGFVPCCFAQSSLYFDTYWATQHLALVWLGCFTMHSAYCYPPSYCDTLHRAALHLGRWVRVHGRNQHIPTHIWDESTLWSQGTLVRHSKDLYKAEGIATAAEPGNSVHGRFYALFNDPSVLVCALLGLQASLVALQLAALARASEWHQVLSVTLLLFANYYMLFRLARNYLVCWKVYKAEQMIQEKMSG
ncbi:hypothetical protein RUM44_012614 [Polyplax serrata]|uniref:Transmembrane protein 39A n=1 Tax=Polyplax serrata TaxID=468196 RepID=A0ABR1BBU3_POLSC